MLPRPTPTPSHTHPHAITHSQAAGEIDNGTVMVLKSLKRQVKSRGPGPSGMVGLSRKFRVADESGDGELMFPEFKKVRAKGALLPLCAL